MLPERTCLEPLSDSHNETAHKGLLQDCHQERKVGTLATAADSNHDLTEDHYHRYRQLSAAQGTNYRTDVSRKHTVHRNRRTAPHTIADSRHDGYACPGAPCLLYWLSPVGHDSQYPDERQIRRVSHPCISRTGHTNGHTIPLRQQTA